MGQEQRVAMVVAETVVVEPTRLGKLLMGVLRGKPGRLSKSCISCYVPMIDKSFMTQRSYWTKIRLMKGTRPRSQTTSCTLYICAACVICRFDHS